MYSILLEDKLKEGAESVSSSPWFLQHLQVSVMVSQTTVAEFSQTELLPSSKIFIFLLQTCEQLAFKVWSTREKN